MASQDLQLECAIDLMLRLPPQQIEKNLSDLIDLVPSLCVDLLAAVDQPLKVARDKETGKDYLLCDCNRDADSYRSPWSNKYDPPLSDGVVPSDRLRRLEIKANQAFDIYRELYFESGLCSVYMWDLDRGFAAAIVIKKVGNIMDVKGCWDSIHIVEVQEKTQGCSAHYTLTSTVMLWLQTIKADSGTMNLGGSLFQKVECDHAVSDFSSHIANIGRMVEDVENKMRQRLNEIYFIKTKDIVNSLRSVGQIALAPAKEHVKNAFQNTSDLTYLCSGLDIPDDKWNVSSAVEYCTQSTDPRKGRKMVYWLDMIGDTALADTVMECAEPPADPSLTPHNLIPVFQALTGDWEKISGYTIVPEARAQLFREKVSARDQLCSEAGIYYALYHHNPNWKELSLLLYRAGETEALQIARPHIQTVAAPQSSSGSGQSTETGEGDTAQHEEFPQQVFCLVQKRGLAILVTCDYEGTGTPPLSSTNGDADEMRRTFEQFDYDIHQLRNGAATEHAITALLKQASDYLSRYGGPKKNRDGEKKVILFAFSGHGTSCGTNEDQIKTNDGQLLSLKEQVRLPLVTHSSVREIPKLFFIDACRGSDHLQHKVVEKGYTGVEMNFRIDYATIPDHKAYGGTYTSIWMPVLARKLRETNAAYSSVIDEVNQEIYEQKDVLQQPQAVAQLSGTLKLYYKAPQSSSGSGQSTETGEGDTAQHGASASSSSQLTKQTTTYNTPTTQDERPKLPKLLCFRTSTGTLNIMSRVGTHYTNLGLILLDDEDGTIVEAITSQFHENAVKITREILTRWIRGEGIQPVTWKTLIDTLRNIGLTELATSIEQGL